MNAASRPVPAGEVGWDTRRRAVLRDALAVGAATGAYGLSFGAIAATAGLSTAQTTALSLLMFTGGSQFALVAVLAGGGGAAAAAAAATLLGSRNAFYGLRLAEILGARGWRRFVAAQFVIDESSAMAVGRADRRSARLAFWATGLSVFVLWNAGTVLGVVGGHAVADPRVLGLDAAAPAAFLALLAPRLRERGALGLAVGAAVLALALTPVVPAGVPILAVAAGTVGIGLAVRPREGGAR